MFKKKKFLVAFVIKDSQNLSLNTLLLILNTKSVYKIFHHMAELLVKLVIDMPPTSEKE